MMATGFEKSSYQSILFNKLSELKTICTIGGLNGGINLFSATSKKAGVIILFNNNFTFQILRAYCDPEGRFNQ